jgi:hypothetical protein
MSNGSHPPKSEGKKPAESKTAAGKKSAKKSK